MTQEEQQNYMIELQKHQIEFYKILYNNIKKEVDLLYNTNSYLTKSLSELDKQNIYITEENMSLRKTIGVYINKSNENA